MTESMPPTLAHLVQRQQLNRYTALLQVVMLVVLAVLSALLFWAVFGGNFWETLSGLVAICFIVLIALRGAINLPGDAATIAVEDISRFVSRVDTATSQLGYSSAAQKEDFFVYEPSAWWKLEIFAWPISVHVHDKQAVIVGPKRYVGRLLKRLAEA